ncbi:hypothetical protein [Sphingomonas oryzagri]
MLNDIEINAVALFAVENLDYSADYEDDAGTFDLNGTRYYWERKACHFNLHIGSEVVKLPRC